MHSSLKTTIITPLMPPQAHDRAFGCTIGAAAEESLEGPVFEEGVARVKARCKRPRRVAAVLEVGPRGAEGRKEVRCRVHERQRRRNGEHGPPREGPVRAHEQPVQRRAAVA